MSKAGRNHSLSAFVNRNDGISADQALARAELHIDAMRSTAEEGLANAIREIGEHLASSDESVCLERLQTLHSLSDGILSVAPLFKKETLGKVAYSLCDLLAVFKERQIWNLPCARIHYDSMRLLQSSPHMNADEQAHLLNALAEIVRAARERGAPASEPPPINRNPNLVGEIRKGSSEMKMEEG